MPGHTHCRICDDLLPDPFFDLGSMPLANSFLSSPADFPYEATYPLAVTCCPRCELVQLNYVVPAEQLFRNYIYVSSTSEAVRRHADVMADALVGGYGWDARHLVVEIGSNDGTVLKAFRQRGVRTLGVEPARNIAALAEAEGIPTVGEFFTEDMAKALLERNGEAAGIIGRHVFAHVDDVHDFLRGASRLLSREGVLIIEVPYLGDLIDKLEFDTVYHEHLSYFSLGPIELLCNIHDLSVVDVERVGLHGGSMILHIRKVGGWDGGTRRLELMRGEERSRALADPRALEKFARDVEIWRGQFEELVRDLVRSGGRLAGYGAAAKANTLLNYCPDVARSLRFILDASPYKQGRYTPGTHLRIEPADRWKEEGVTHMLVLAWNLKEEIIRQMQPFAMRGGRFVIPIPEPAII